LLEGTQTTNGAKGEKEEGGATADPLAKVHSPRSSDKRRTRRRSRRRTRWTRRRRRRRRKGRRRRRRKGKSFS
jgi:hypothetical protein